MKILFNPTNDTIEVQIFGVKYVVDPQGTIELIDEAAHYWVKNLHSFMEEVDKLVEDVKEVIADVEKVKEDVVEIRERAVEIKEVVAKKVTKK